MDGKLKYSASVVLPAPPRIPCCLVQLNCASVINLVCGKSIMHSIDEVLIPVTEPIEDKK